MFGRIAPHLALCLSLLLAGLQPGALFHGASYGFANHVHGGAADIDGIVAFDSPVLSVFDVGLVPAHQKPKVQPQCELQAYIDHFCKSSGLSGLVASIVFEPEPDRVWTELLVVSGSQRIVGARAPPSYLHS